MDMIKPMKANTVEWSNGVNCNSNVQIADTSSKSKLGKSFEIRLKYIFFGLV